VAERFNYKTKAEQAGQTDFGVLSAPMGDGYTQRAANGINTQTDTWNLTARGIWLDTPPSGCPFAGQDVKGIHEFIKRHKGYIAFQWKAPDGLDAWWLCPSVAKVKDAPGVMSLSFTFIRTYVP
jgi:phage-related protein